MKKAAFTLIETVASLFILTILFSLAISLCKLGTNIKSDVEESGCIYEIQSLLTYGKAVCSEKNKYGKITITANKNQIRFIEGWDGIEKIINLPKGIQIISKDISIYINPDGRIAQGTTIELIDKNKERQDITIGVGVDLIVIKDGKFI